MVDYRLVQQVQSVTRTFSRLASYDHSPDGVVAPAPFPTLMELDELLTRFRELCLTINVMEECGWLADGAVDMLIMDRDGVVQRKGLSADLYGETGRFESDWLGDVVEDTTRTERLQAWARKVDDILGSIDGRLVADPEVPLSLLGYAQPNYDILTWKLQRLHLVLATALVSYSTSHAGDFDLAVFGRPVRFFQMSPVLTFCRRDVESEFGPLWVLGDMDAGFVEMEFHGFEDEVVGESGEEGETFRERAG